MTKRGKTIQIYLPDGNPRSVKIAEFTSRTVQAILIPRAQLEQAYKRAELSNVGGNGVRSIRHLASAFLSFFYFDSKAC